MQALDEMEGLSNADDPHTFQKYQRSVRQIVLILQRISQAWRVSYRLSEVGQPGSKLILLHLAGLAPVHLL